MRRPRRCCRRGLGVRGVVVVVRLSAGSLGGDFGDGGSGAGFVNDRLVAGVGGDQGLDGEVVHRAGQAAGDLVDQRGRVVAEQGVGTAGEFEVVGEVAGGLGVGHAGHRVSEGDALVEGGDGAELDPSPQGGLADEEAGEW